ncbi:MAG: cache domain-containing protein, partial [Desulfopila sp.]|nr:cache domain-containing protein [Desulfopila sp.]
MFFRRLLKSLRSRIFFSFLLALLPVLLCIIAAIEILLVPAISADVRQDLTNSTRLLKKSIEAGATVAVRNHLKAIAEKNAEIIAHHLSEAAQGLLGREEAIARVRSILLSQRIGTSGYIYCLNSEGVAVIHPNPGVEHTDNTGFAFVREQMERKQGYIEYEWRNPGENTERSKALYMTYFEPLDWIISVSSYRSEFSELVDINDFRDMILSLRFGKSGYAYVLNTKGDTLIHPQLSDYNALQQSDLPSDFVQTMIETGSGSIEYEWQNPEESMLRKKIAVYESIPEYGWIIVSASYFSEVMRPAVLAQKAAYSATLLLLITAALASYYLSGRITRPVDAMIRQLDKNRGSTTVEPLPEATDDEFGRLGFEFNRFLEEIAFKNEELVQEKERYLSLFETSPDAVFLLRGTIVIDCNSTTLSIFAAGEKAAVIGSSIFDLSPPYQTDGRGSVDSAVEILERMTRENLQIFEWTHKKVNGELFDAEVRLKTFGMSKGEPLLVAFVRDITEWKKALEGLRQSEMQYRLLVENAGDAIFIAQGEKIVFSNSKTALLTGYSFTELKDIPFSRFIKPSERKAVLHKFLNEPSISGVQFTFTFIGKSGHEYIVQLHSVVIDWDGEPASLNFVRDVTEQKKLEAILHQAQKMEAVGTLAGGIAHDFNNILMGIQGRVSLLSVEEKQDSKTQEHLQAIEEHVRSAADLTGRLLGFARGGKYRVEPTDLNELVRVGVALFGRTKKEMEIRVTPSDTRLVSDIDRRQIEQVLLNMYLNAWQAMPGGGTLSIATSMVTLDESSCKPHQADPGNYARITVRDTGVGMSESVRQRIFDPFFTTKKQGRGTGLGLASAYGIVRNHDGFITVYSEEGLGTAFNIYLPLSSGLPQPSSPEPVEIYRGSETVLLVDDEKMIIEVGRAMLEKLGYRVLSASSGEQALQCLEKDGEAVDLVILDLVMPGLDGAATFEKIREMNPAQLVLLSSGYAIDGVAGKVMQKGCCAFIQKPFSLVELSRILRKVLGDD